MSAQLSWTDWSFEPTVTLGLAALLALYIIARRAGWVTSTDNVSHWLPTVRWRAPLFGLGIAIAYVALQSPIDTGGDDYLLAIHMVQHLLLMMVAPPLLLLGIAGATPLAQLPASRLGRIWEALTGLWTACLLFNLVLLIWHIPQLYNTTLTVAPLHILEHFTFFLAGLIFWWPIVDPIDAPGRLRVQPFAKVAMLVIAGIPPTILGLLFSASGHAFYPFYVAAPRLWGLSPLTDQQIAGVVMFGLGNLVYFAAIAIIFMRLFSDPARDEAGTGPLTPGPAAAGGGIGPNRPIA